MAEATTASFFKKRSPRTRSRLSYSSASEDDGGGKTPLAVPEGLRGLLNDVSREVGFNLNYFSLAKNLKNSDYTFHFLRCHKNHFYSCTHF